MNVKINNISAGAMKPSLSVDIVFISLRYEIYKIVIYINVFSVQSMRENISGLLYGFISNICNTSVACTPIF